MNLLDAAKKERATLLKESEGIKVKLEALEALISAYGTEAGVLSPAYALPPLSTKQRALSAIEALLKTQQRVPINEIVAHLGSKGLFIPRETLGVYLSKDERFESDRVNGWCLKNTGEVATSPVSEIESNASDLV